MITSPDLGEPGPSRGRRPSGAAAGPGQGPFDVPGALRAHPVEMGLSPGSQGCAGGLPFRCLSLRRCP
jgi:hypothetical protein